MPDPDPTLPLLEEELSVGRRRVAGDRVRVRTVTHEHPQLIDQELTREQVEIRRLPVGRVIDAAPPVRQEGDVLIVPVVEEVLVVERRLILKEEIHVQRRQVSERHRETVMLRGQEAEITRSPADPAPSNPPPRNAATSPPHPLAEEQRK